MRSIVSIMVLDLNRSVVKTELMWYRECSLSKKDRSHSSALCSSSVPTRAIFRACFLSYGVSRGTSVLTRPVHTA